MIEGSMDVSGGSAHVREDALVVTVRLRNRSDRTMYAYEEARKIQYDAATKRLRLLFHDHEADPVVEQHLLRPHIKEIPAGEEADVQVRLPHEMRRLRSAEESAGLAASGDTSMYDVQRLADADNVDIEVAIADTPFYPAVGEDSMGTELRAWAPDTLSTSLSIEK